jgi:hypothetical protein
MGLTFEFEQPISDEYALKFDHTGISYDCSPGLLTTTPEIVLLRRQPAMLENRFLYVVKQADDKESISSSVFIPAR